jgi:hypothetical protein
MYNRYIPQQDGSHRRRFVPDPPKPQPCCPPPPVTEPECITPAPPPPQPRRQNCPSRQEAGAFGFLKNILPRDFDTGDLMIILLLLLMAGDCQEDQNWAMLTLALYLFL